MMRVKPAAILREVAHRPWPLPRGPWVMRQTWDELLFAHWPVAPDALRPLIPAGLDLDTYAGQAWISIVPFRMTGVRVRGLPPIPGASRFPELNVRTYVSVGGKAGVYFVSLEAGSRMAVAVARATFFLPYYLARFTIARAGDTMRYACQRRQRGPGGPVELVVSYRPTGPVFTAPLGSLDEWLTARYCLYSVGSGGRVFRGEIHHKPWPLQSAVAEFGCNTMASAQGIALPDTPPLLHYAHRLDILAWRIRPLGIRDGVHAARELRT